MKTYKEEINKPRLVIEYDNDIESPRNDSNLGYFITVDSNYSSPDEEKGLNNFIKETGGAESQEKHIEFIKEYIEKELIEKVLAIYPITKYEHSSVSYSLGDKAGFDYSNNGFYIITDKTAGELGAKKKDFEKIIENELEFYNQYVNGEVYRFTLYNDKGEIEDSCSGFYDIEDIMEYLPKEWKNEDLNDYLIN